MVEQEKPKQIKCYCGHTDYCDCSPLEELKQETTAKEFYDKHYSDDVVVIMRDYAKMQDERTEEIIRKAYFDRTDNIDVDGYWISDPEKDLEMLIEQFKKQKDG
jgi:hypothetical protein